MPPSGDPGLPAGSAPSLLLTVLGNLVLHHGGTVWTASLLYVMTGLGLEEQTARQAIARAADAGLIDPFARLDPEPGDDLLFTYVALLNEYRQFPAMDPQLPEDLLPGWVGRRAAAMFVERHRGWRGPARDRWREIVRATAPQP